MEKMRHDFKSTKSSSHWPVPGRHEQAAGRKTGVELTALADKQTLSLENNNILAKGTLLSRELEREIYMNRQEENGFDGICGCILLKGAKRVVSPHAPSPGLFQSADVQGTSGVCQTPCLEAQEGNRTSPAILPL